jgi:YVTN family beta-propeller protein
VYVPNLDSDSVSVINSSYQVIATVPVQHGPIFTSVDETNNLIYALNWYSDTVSVIDGATNTVIATVPVGANPRRAAIDPATHDLYVANAFGNTVSVLNGGSTVVTLAAGLEPRFVLFNSLNGYIYVSNRADGTVSVFNGLTKLNDVVVGALPEDMAVDLAGNVYVANYGSNNISVIQGISVINTIPVGSGPEGLAMGVGQVFVANSLENTISVVEGGQVVASYVVGQTPRTLAYDLTTDRVTIANYEGASLSILDPEAPQVTFSGAPLNGPAPLDVQFTSVVTGAVTIYSWNFGDGDGSSLANPGHTYINAGSFGVHLVVTGPGGSASTYRDGYVQVDPAPGAPTADFSADVTHGPAPLEVTFTAVTTGTVDTWAWDFGDGSNAATGPVVSHTYTTLGAYSVVLQVSNSNGGFIVSKPSYISVHPDSTFAYLPIVSK